MQGRLDVSAQSWAALTCAPCPFHPEQDGKCKFQPEKAIAFVKDVANITLVSTDLSPMRRQGGLVPRLMVTPPQGGRSAGLAGRRSDLGLPKSSRPSFRFPVYKMQAIVPALRERV